MMRSNTLGEVFLSIKDSPNKVASLKNFDSANLRLYLRVALDSTCRWFIDATPHYNKSRQPIQEGFGETDLNYVARNITTFLIPLNGQPKQNPMRDFTMKKERLIRTLESLSTVEAEVLDACISKDLKPFGITVELVNEAFHGLLGKVEKTVDNTFVSQAIVNDASKPKRKYVRSGKFTKGK